jgi:hypothetical protein
MDQRTGPARQWRHDLTKPIPFHTNSRKDKAVNKVILITGASSGFGRLTANALADAREHRRAFESEVLTPR